MKVTYKNGVFNFELDGYAVELYKENEIWLDKVYTLFGHVINRVSSERSIKLSSVKKITTKRKTRYFTANPKTKSLPLKKVGNIGRYILTFSGIISQQQLMIKRTGRMTKQSIIIERTGHFK